VVDATYPELARSILEQHSYQTRFLPQTTLPPGLPVVLAVVGWLAGFTPAVLFPVIAVSTTLALIAAYELLRCVEGRFMVIIAAMQVMFDHPLTNVLATSRWSEDPDQWTHDGRVFAYGAFFSATNCMVQPLVAVPVAA